MSTPMETVRDFLNRHGMPPNGPGDDLGVALAHVLRDAERYAALEKEHASIQYAASGWCWFETGDFRYLPYREPLSELADRLREGK